MGRLRGILACLAPKLNRAPPRRAGASERIAGSGRDELGQIGSVCEMRRCVKHFNRYDAARGVEIQHDAGPHLFRVSDEPLRKAEV